MPGSLQTLAFIRTIDNLFKGGRSPDTDDENELLIDFKDTRELLNHTFRISHIILLWNDDDKGIGNVTRRKNLIKTLELSFHMHFKKLNDTFKKVRNSYLRIAPGIEKLFVFSIPSADDLVVLYSQKYKLLESYLYRTTTISEEDREEKSRKKIRS